VSVPNASQENADNDEFGDACEPSVDCATDADGDGIGDALLSSCDNCPGNAYVARLRAGDVVVAFRQRSRVVLSLTAGTTLIRTTATVTAWVTSGEPVMRVTLAVMRVRSMSRSPSTWLVTCSDNCPDDENSNQADGNGNGVGDACDSARCSSVCLIDCDDPSQGAVSCTGDSDGRCADGWSAIAGLRGCERECVCVCVCVCVLDSLPCWIVAWLF
jgi:hypothetical protein